MIKIGKNNIMEELHTDYSSGEGPRCPNPKCHRQYTATGCDPCYFDENGFEEECDECGTNFFVQPIISVSWRTSSIPTKKKKILQNNGVFGEPAATNAQDIGPVPEIL